MFQEAEAPGDEDRSPAETSAPAEELTSVPAPAPTPAGGVSLSISQGNNLMLHEISQEVTNYIYSNTILRYLYFTELLQLLHCSSLGIFYFVHLFDSFSY